jgi:hypothetical protein
MILSEIKEYNIKKVLRHLLFLEDACVQVTYLLAESMHHQLVHGKSEEVYSPPHCW